MENATIIYMDGESLTPDDLYNLSKGNIKISLKEKTWQRIEEARNVINTIIESKEVVYGVNTGFGNFANVVISQKDLQQLQKNLIRSHSVGVGSPIPLEQVRMLLGLRINVLSKGYSGISKETLEKYIIAFNNDILPFIPEKGTVGASGDLAPLSHLALGEGKIWDHEIKMYADAALVLQKKNFQPIVLKEKEGLALINGTQFMTAIGCQSLIRAERLARLADYVSAITFESQIGDHNIMNLKVHELKGYKGQIEVAKRLQYMIIEKKDRKESLSELSQFFSNQEDLIKQKIAKNNQDAYTILCIPQVHGITHDTLEFVREILYQEINSATDNPLVFKMEDHESFEKDCMLSGGNFHGEYSSKVLDYLTIAIHEIGSISERRIERLVNPTLSNLPDFLVKDGGLNSGFMMIHCTAASLVSENKTLCHPASVDTITTSANQEDHVSMGGWSARKSLKVVENVEYIVAIELITACQALDLLPRKSTQRIQKLHSFVRQYVPFLDQDFVFNDKIETICQLIRDGVILELIENSSL